MEPIRPYANIQGNENIFNFRWTYSDPNAYSGCGSFRGDCSTPSGLELHLGKRRKTSHGNSFHTHGRNRKRTQLRWTLYHRRHPIRNIWLLDQLEQRAGQEFEDIFQLSHGPAMLATAAWFLAYLVFSVPAAKVIEKVGYKRTMVISLLVMAGGALLFLPAANMVSFPMTLFAIFILASGVCGLQTSANPYVSILGPEHSAPARLTLAQAFNSIGSFAAPWVAGVFILSGSNLAADAHATAHMLQGPYIAIAAALLLLSFAVMMMHLPAITGTRDFRPGDVASGRSIWSYSHTVLGMVGIFFYVGLEIALAAITIQFCLSQGMTKVETASLMVSLFYFGMMVGRLLGSFIMVWIKAEKLLVLLGGLGVALLLTAMFTHGTVAIACPFLPASPTRSCTPTSLPWALRNSAP